ncbi:hypothetical protein F4778DRAFT_202307 [Xylariomycetidae sp. FL2044]|nr:hypothetical protein F4778DRAFT_202307 [Xylariomycetidae sp. FL2044]
MSSQGRSYYQPMDLVIQGPGRGDKGSGGPYHGTTDMTRTMGKEISDNENCCLYIVVPGTVTHSDALDTIPKVGKIKALHINPPSAGKPNTSNIKLTFFKHNPARELLALMGAKQWKLGDGRLPQSYCWNRFGVRAENDTGKSRVLKLTGPRRLVTEDALTEYFKTKLKYDVQKMESHVGETTINTVTIFFGSYSNQAQGAHDALRKEHPDLMENKDAIRAEFCPDPCDPSGQV